MAASRDKALIPRSGSAGSGQTPHSAGGRLQRDAAVGVEDTHIAVFSFWLSFILSLGPEGLLW